MNLFGKEFDLCSNEQQTQIADEVPIRITEVYVASNSNEVKKGDTKWSSIAVEIMRFQH